MRYSRFISTSMIYFIGNVLSKIVSFLLLPLYTKYLTSAQFGEYDIVISFVNLVAPVAFVQIWDGMYRYSFEEETSKGKFKIINNTICISGGGVLLYILLQYVLNNIYSFDCFYIVLAYGLVFSIQYIYTFAVRVFLNNKLFVMSGVVCTIVTAITNIVLLTQFALGISSLYIAAITGCFVQIFIIELRIHLIKNFRLVDMDLKLCKRLIRFSAPLCIATISYWLLTGFSKVCISRNLSIEDNGIFAIANRFSSMIVLFVAVFQFAWNETAYLMAHNSKRIEKFQLCISLLVRILLMGSVIACLVIKHIFPYLVDKHFHASYYIIPIVIMGVSFNSIAGFLGTIFMTEKNTNFVLLSTLIAATFNCALCGLGIRYFGLNGALIVLTLSFFILVLVRIVYLNLKLGVDIRYHDFLYGGPYILAWYCFKYNSGLCFDFLALLCLSIILLFGVLKLLKREKCK